jgi:signal transduction histidine kinase
MNKITKFHLKYLKTILSIVLIIFLMLIFILIKQGNWTDFVEHSKEISFELNGIAIMFLFLIGFTLFVLFTVKELLEATGEAALSTIQTQAERIEKLERNERLTSYASHNLKNAMNNLFFEIKNASAELPETQAEELENTFNHLNAILTEMRNLEAAEQQTSFTLIDLETAITKFNRYYFQRHKVAFSWKYENETDKNTVVDYPYRKFFEVVQNLIVNAVEAMPNTKMDKILIIAIKKDKKSLIFEVSDNGTPIKASDLARIYEKGFSTKNSTGIGLTYVKEIVENAKGKVEITNNDGANAFKTFKISIPTY